MYIHNDSNDEYVIVKFKLKKIISDYSLFWRSAKQF